MLRSQSLVRNNWRVSARRLSQLADSFQRDGFIQQHEVVTGGPGDMFIIESHTSGDVTV